MPESNLDQISPETGNNFHRVAMTQVAAPTKPPTGSTLQRKNCVMPPRMRPLALVPARLKKSRYLTGQTYHRKSERCVILSF